MQIKLKYYFKCNEQQITNNVIKQTEEKFIKSHWTI